MSDQFTRQQRLAIMRGNLEFLTGLLKTFHGDIEVAMCRLAVHIAFEERRPASLSDVAAMTGLPRTTVIRKLKGQPDIYFELTNGRSIARCRAPCTMKEVGIASAYKLLNKVWEEVSKLDTKSFDGYSTET